MKTIARNRFARTALLFALGAAGSGLSVRPALAQNAASQLDAPIPVASNPPPAAPNSATSLSEIVVTAQKQQSTAQTVPAAIVAADASLIQSMQIMTTNDLTTIAPSLQLTPVRDQSAIFIRGIGQGVIGVNSDPYVAFNLNDAYLPAQVTNIAFYDLDRVEVLYGPQGTLYGRNALSGIINVFSRRPTFDFGSSADIEYGNYATVNGTAVLNVPLSPTLAARLAVNRTSHSGYISNGTQDDDTNGGRLSLLYQPNATTSALLVAAISHSTGFGQGEFVNKPALACGFFCYPFNASALGINAHATIYSVSLEVSSQVTDGVTIGDVAAYSSDRNDQTLLLALGPLASPNPTTSPSATNFDNYSNEFKINASFGRLDLVTGLYGYYTDSNGFIEAKFYKTGPFSLVGPAHVISDGAALYEQLTYHATDSLRVTSGVRYSYDKRDFSGSNSSFPGGVQTVTQTYANSYGRSRPDFKGTIEYDVAPRSMAYGTVATGYNAGGFSTSPIAPGSTVAAPFAPTTALAFAVGDKNRFFDNQLQLNVELFYNRYKDYQVSARSPVTGQTTVYNAALAITKGVQVDFEWKPRKDDDLTVGVGLLDGKESQLVLPPPLNTNYSGLDLPFAPHATVNASFSHTQRMGNIGQVEARVSGRYVSREWLQYTHANGLLNDAYAVMDASLTYRRREDGRWSIGLWGRNLTNTETYVFGSAPAVPGPALGSPYQPRTYGVRLTGEF